MEFSWSCVAQSFQTAPPSLLPQQKHKQPRNYQRLCERTETDAEECRHGGSVSPRVHTLCVVPFAPDRISEPGKQEKSTGRVAVLNEPKPRAKPQRGPPKRAEKNQDITNRAMEAGPKNVSRCLVGHDQRRERNDRIPTQGLRRGRKAQAWPRAIVAHETFSLVGWPVSFPTRCGSS